MNEGWVRESARSLEANAPRKHHVVPGSYLRRWEHDGGLWVSDRVASKTYRGRANKIARETDFYRLDSDQVDGHKVPPLVAEFLLSQIEGAAVGAIDALVDADGIVDDSNLDRFNATNFIAMQALRGRRARTGHESLTAGFHRYVSQFGLDPGAVRAQYDGEMSDEMVASIIGINEQVSSGDAQVLPTQVSSIALAFEMLESFGEEIFTRRWVVYTSDAPLLTTDEPVVALGGRFIDRGSVPGPAIAGVMMLALDPCHLLAMFHRDMLLSPRAVVPTLSAVETDEVNIEIAAHAHRLIVSSGRKKSPDRLPSLPPLVPPSQVEDPVPIRNSDENAELIAFFQPSPWLYVPDQPLPVARWWDLDERTYSWKRPDSPWMPGTGMYVDSNK
jgi:hypothetical protein